MSGLTVERYGRLLRLTLARPEKRNALSLALCEALGDAIESAEPATTGCILLDAEGPSFCAGMDLRESLGVDPQRLAAAHERLFGLYRTAKVPVVAAVQGHALAGGTGLAAQAHIVYASETAEFGLTEIRIGIWPLLIYRSLEAAVGPRRILEWGLTGRRIPANEAKEAGLVQHVVRPEELSAKAEGLGREIASRSPDAIAAAMLYHNHHRGLSEESSRSLARELRESLMSSPTYREAIDALLKKS
jgi:enoyl-CoA hydratase/carnithine racemase